MDAIYKCVKDSMFPTTLGTDLSSEGATNKENKETK